MVILLITQAVGSELQIQFPISINVYSICCFSLSLSVFWWVDCVTYIANSIREDLNLGIVHSICLFLVLVFGLLVCDCLSN